MDGDSFDYREELSKMMDSIIKNDIDQGIGTRVRELRENGENAIENLRKKFTYTEVPVRYNKKNWHHKSIRYHKR